MLDNVSGIFLCDGPSCLGNNIETAMIVMNLHYEAYSKHTWKSNWEHVVYSPHFKWP